MTRLIKRNWEPPYGRLGHIHGDLEASVANDNTNKTAVINNDNANMTSIINNDDANKTTIINNDNANTAALTTTVNANTASIIANDNANTAAIIANDNANKNELRDLILRTQIEADLAQPDSSTPVAVFVTPTANGGYLNLVRAIVAQTMANVLAAGGKVGQAQSLLAQGDAAKTAGDFKVPTSAYRSVPGSGSIKAIQSNAHPTEENQFAAMGERQRSIAK